ncbi:MAG: hypothetical protein KIT13_03710 [Burkholderiales bacterium]|nr:hypothetical protein [Burkholderiales bacterium]
MAVVGTYSIQGEDMNSWGILHKGGNALVFKRDDALEVGVPGPLKEELVVVYTLNNAPGHAIQCTRAGLSEMLRCLAPAEVRVYQPDAQIMAAVHEAAMGEGAGNTMH